MNKLDFRLLTLAAFLGGCATAAPPNPATTAQIAVGPTAPARPTPPAARVVAHRHTLHGDVRQDPYFWLRDRNNPEVISYLEAENRYTDAMMEPTRALQEKLYQEMLGRIQQTDLSVPTRRGPYYYYTRTVEGQQYPIFARKRGAWTRPSRCCSIRTRWPGGTSTSGSTP